MITTRLRVQRSGETLSEAAQKLARASIGKQAKIMFVIALAHGGCLEFAEELPPGAIAIEPPALGIGEYLDNLKS